MRKMIATTLLAGLMLIGGALPSFARGNNCQQRVRKAEHNLQQAIHRHGRNSRQAQARRQQLERAQESCQGQRGRYRY